MSEKVVSSQVLFLCIMEVMIGAILSAVVILGHAVHVFKIQSSMLNFMARFNEP